MIAETKNRTTEKTSNRAADGRTATGTHVTTRLPIESGIVVEVVLNVIRPRGALKSICTPIQFPELYSLRATLGPKRAKIPLGLSIHSLLLQYRLDQCVVVVELTEQVVSAKKIHVRTDA